jgi:hypothetical protein
MTMVRGRLGWRLIAPAYGPAATRQDGSITQTLIVESPERLLVDACDRHG